MACIGYARVSTQGQDLTAQLEALKAAGAEPIYKEKISGVRADRPQLARLMARLMPGDVVAVTKLDRLGRSTRELLELIERIGKAGASFRSIGDPLWGYVVIPRPAAVNAACRHSRLRARPDPGTHRGRPQARRGQRRQVRSEAQAERLSAH
jgi:hypothetical protein